MLTSCKGHSSREFLIERPTPSDIALWCTALKSLTSVTYTLPSPLGPFLQIPSTTTSWQISADHTCLYRSLPNGSLDVYTQHGRPTRQRKFIRHGSIPTLYSTQHLKLATVFPTHCNDIVSFHSSVFQPITFQPPSSSVLNVLKSGKNPRLWDDFKCNGNRWWIRDALFSRSLLMVSNGLYTRDRHTGTCSRAFVLYCSKMRNKASCGWAEVQVKSNSYRGEFLGAVDFLLIISAVLLDETSKLLRRQHNDTTRAKAYSDCKGVISHGNDQKPAARPGTR